MNKPFRVLLLLIMASVIHAAQPAEDQVRVRKPVEAISAEKRQAASEAINRAIGFLKATQRADGGWEHTGRSDPAITALAARCFIQHPEYGPQHPIVDKAIGLILTFRHDDGGIYPEGAGLQNYYTSVCLMALAALRDKKYENHIAEAEKCLKKLQWDEGEDIDPNDPWYGGAGYGQSKRPDLSNTQMMLEALKQSGVPSTDPTYRKALKFIERSQMLSAGNDQAFARGADDGGFVYTPANGGESKAGTVVVDGQPRLRSYGSMTYAGFKSYLYADLAKNDSRVQAAYKWIREYYTLDSNPNMPGEQSLEGLYYYYQVFAKAFEAWGDPVIVDAKGRPHNWREELTDKLISLQNKDGSWVNTADRWYESNPALVTAYAVLALQTAVK